MPLGKVTNVWQTAQDLRTDTEHQDKHVTWYAHQRVTNGPGSQDKHLTSGLICHLA